MASSLLNFTVKVEKAEQPEMTDDKPAEPDDPVNLDVTNKVNFVKVEPGESAAKEESASESGKRAANAGEGISEGDESAGDDEVDASEPSHGVTNVDLKYEVEFSIKDEDDTEGRVHIPVEEHSSRTKPVKTKPLRALQKCRAAGKLTNQQVRARLLKKPLACIWCKYRCRHETYLKIHMRSHTGEKPFPCTICDYKASRKANLKNHMRTHIAKPLRTYSCEYCDFKSTEGREYKRHIRIHRQKQYVCDECIYRCKNRAMLRKHMFCHSGVMPYECELCDYRCMESRDLRMHGKTHRGEKSFTCTVCPYRSSAANMKIHIRTHTYACDLCEYKCSTAGDLQVHKMVHTVERPYSCSICDQQFRNASHLKKHTKQKHEPLATTTDPPQNSIWISQAVAQSHVEDTQGLEDEETLNGSPEEEPWRTS